jgi:hypothetical protein
VPRRQRAEASRDAVVRLGVICEGVDDLAPAPDFGDRFGSEFDPGAAARDRDDVVSRQLTTSVGLTRP